MDDRTPLTPADELRLARAIEAGLLARDRLERSGDAELEELGELVRCGEAAQRRLVAANLALVGWVVRRVAWATELPAADLFQDGCLGLIEAVQRYDHARGVRFATYALIRIRAAVGEAVRRAQPTPGLTATARRERESVRRAEADLVQRLGRSVAVAEVAAVVATGADRVALLLAAEPLESEAEPPAVAVEPARPAAGSCAALLERLPATHRRVLELRFGFDGPPCSLREVALRVGATLSVVRRWEREALEQVRDRCPVEARSLL